MYRLTNRQTGDTIEDTLDSILSQPIAREKFDVMTEQMKGYHLTRLALGIPYSHGALLVEKL